MKHQIHPLRYLWLAAVLALAGCVTPPQKVIQTACQKVDSYSTERCAKGIAETYEVYQKRAEGIVTNPATPADVKRPIQKADALATPIMVKLLESAALYASIKLQLGNGTTEEQLAVANANLEAWVQQALPLIDGFRKALNGETP